MKFVDLSVPIVHGLPVDPPVQIPTIEYTNHKDSVDEMLTFFPGTTKEDLLDGAGWAVEKVILGTHTGTHIDAPYHYHPTMNCGEPAWTIDEVPLDWFYGDGVVLDFTDKPDGYVCTPEDLQEKLGDIGYTLKPGDIVFVRTAAAAAWGSPKYLSTGCGFGRAATLWLIEQGVRLVGTDAWSWDAPLGLIAEHFRETGDSSLIWEGHKAGAEKAYCQIEKLCNLESLPPYGFRVSAFPVKIERASAGWARVVAMIDD